jgi:triacylglycerol lipase
MADLPAPNRWNSLVRESLALGELAALMRDPIYRGDSVPRGDGRLVVLIPGLFASDFYLWPLRRWLARIGYRPSTSGLWVNAGCADRLTAQIEKWIERQSRGADGRVVLVGHSRGGILARALAAKLRRPPSHLILLGSPVAQASRFAQSRMEPELLGQASSALMRASNTARRILDPECSFPECGCGFVNAMRAELDPSIAVLSIYSREDPIVPPQACVITGGRNVEVRGTHSGLAYNPAVYRELARSLP